MKFLWLENLIVEGMTCTACSARVEKVLNKLDGVVNASMNLLLTRP